MPITYEIDTTRGLVRTRCTGQVFLPEVLAHFDQLQKEPLRPALLDVLLDLRGLETAPKGDQLRTVADRIGRVGLQSFGRCAILVDRDLLFGVARMFEAFANTQFQEVSIHRQPGDAEAWLNRARAGNAGQGG